MDRNSAKAIETIALMVGVLAVVFMGTIIGIKLFEVAKMGEKPAYTTVKQERTKLEVKTKPNTSVPVQNAGSGEMLQKTIDGRLLQG